METARNPSTWAVGLPQDEVGWALFGADAQFALGKPITVNLVWLAGELLLRDQDSPALRTLAGADPESEFRFDRDIYTEVVADPGRRPLSHEAALWHYIQFLSREMLLDRISLIHGCQRVYAFAYTDDLWFASINEFSGMLDYLEGGWFDPPTIEQAARELASRTLEVASANDWEDGQGVSFYELGARSGNIAPLTARKVAADLTQTPRDILARLAGSLPGRRRE